MSDLKIEEYRAMKAHERIAYLEGHVFDDGTTELSGEFVYDALKGETAATAQWFLIKAVGILKLATGLSEVLRLCKLPEVEMRHTTLHAICAWSLGRLGTSAYEPVAELMNDPIPETRRCAADALGEIGDKRAIQRLCTALEQDDRPVKLWAGLSLAKMGDTALPCLERLAKASDALVRQVAADAIDKIGRKELAMH
jgi:hypothetical protein